MPLSHHLSLDTDSILGSSGGNTDGIISYRTANSLNGGSISTEITTGFSIGWASIQNADSNSSMSSGQLVIVNSSWYEIHGRMVISDNSTDNKFMTAMLFCNDDTTGIKNYWFNFTQTDTSTRYFSMPVNSYVYLEGGKSYQWFITGNSGFVYVPQTEIYLKKLNTTHTA